VTYPDARRTFTEFEVDLLRTFPLRPVIRGLGLGWVGLGVAAALHTSDATALAPTHVPWS